MYDHDYLEYQNQLLNTMSNYNVRVAESEWNLDYTRFKNSQSIKIEKEDTSEQE